MTEDMPDLLGGTFDTFMSIYWPEALPNQITHMRRAFYGGASCVLNAMKSLGDFESEEEFVDRVGYLLHEIEIFSNRVGIDK